MHLQEADFQSLTYVDQDAVISILTDENGYSSKSKSYISCEEVPLKLHAHQFRHAKASHWLEDGMNIVQISFLLGHSDVRTTMIYLDVTTEAELKAMATLEDESEEKVTKKWKAPGNKLSSFFGLKTLKK